VDRSPTVYIWGGCVRGESHPPSPLQSPTFDKHARMLSLDRQALTECLPGEKKLHSAQDAIAVLLHTAMVQLGFCLISVGGHSLPDPNNVLPEDRAKGEPQYSYTFRYKYDESSSEFSLGVHRHENRTVCEAIILGGDLDGAFAAFQILTNDFISTPPFPHNVSTASTGLESIFTSKIDDLISKFLWEIVLRVFPAWPTGEYMERPEAAPPSKPDQPPLSSVNEPLRAGSPSCGTRHHTHLCDMCSLRPPQSLASDRNIWCGHLTKSPPSDCIMRIVLLDGSFPGGADTYDGDSHNNRRRGWGRLLLWGRR